MGLEAACRVSFDGKVSAGKALLESAELLFRGDFRVKIPFQQISALEAKNGRLTVAFPQGVAHFELGPAAEKWRDKIRHPKSLLDKLGVKADSRVAVLDIDDGNFRAQLSERTSERLENKLAKECDFIFFGVTCKSSLRRLDNLLKHLAKTGAIWVIYPKGQPLLNENDVRNAGKAAGLVDIKVVGFSSTHSGLKLVIPKTKR